MRCHFVVAAVILVVAASSGFAQSLPYEDEDILGLEVSGDLLAPSALVSQIRQDLAEIRSAFPEISDIHVFPSWKPGEILVALTDEAWAEYEAGTFLELDALNAEYGPVAITPRPWGRYLFMRFEVLYHPEVLSGIYEADDGVRYAETNSSYGDGSDIFIEQLPVYTFKRGWGDCPSGCIFADYWEFSVSGEVVDLIAHYGSSVSAVGSSPVGQAALIRRIAPNPFNPSTTINYVLQHEDWVKLEVFDLRGRPVVELVNRYVLPGEHVVTWRGVDRAGAPVASGLYFCRLVVDGVAQVQGMTLLK